MRCLSLALLWGLLCAAPCAIAEARQAPVVSLSDLHHQVRRIGPYRARLTLVHFWASWCGPCVKELPQLLELVDSHRVGEVALVLVAADSHAAVVEFLAAHPMDYPVLIDQYGTGLRRFGVQVIPTTVVIDQRGRILQTLVGAQEWDANRLEDWLRQSSRR